MDQLPGPSQVLSSGGRAGLAEQHFVPDAVHVPSQVGVGATGSGSDFQHDGAGGGAECCGQGPTTATSGGIVLLGLCLGPAAAELSSPGGVTNAVLTPAHDLVSSALGLVAWGY